MTAVFALGSNGAGQLGIGQQEDVSVPKPVLFAEPLPSGTVTSIAAGGNHTLLLSDAGDLYCSGDPTSGACGPVTGSPNPSNITRFQKMVIPSSQPVKMLAATWESSVFTSLDAHGKNRVIYSCGIGNKGELGHGPLLVRLPKPSVIPDFPPPDNEIADLAACMSHVEVVLSNGEAYGWGNGRKGQLGGDADIVCSPRQIPGLDFAARRVVCGKDFTCLVGDVEGGQFLILGSDKWGVRSKAPPTLAGRQDIGASWGNIFILGSHGQLTSWGRDDYSQNVAQGTPAISRFAAGSEHAVALSVFGVVLAWGWGEHGNCGPPTQPDGSSKGRRNTIVSSKYIPPGSKITGVGAGCATSWVIIEPSPQDPDGD